MIAQSVLTARLSRITLRLVTDATRGERPVGKRKHRQLRRRFDAALREMTLESYVAWCNRGEGELRLMDAAAWRERGVSTAAELGRILDAECRRACDKADRDRYYSDLDD